MGDLALHVAIGQHDQKAGHGLPLPASGIAVQRRHHQRADQHDHHGAGQVEQIHKNIVQRGPVREHLARNFYVEHPVCRPCQRDAAGQQVVELLQPAGADVVGPRPDFYDEQR